MHRKLTKKCGNTLTLHLLGIVLLACGDLFAMPPTRDGKCYNMLRNNASSLVYTKKRKLLKREKVIRK